MPWAALQCLSGGRSRKREREREVATRSGLRPPTQACLSSSRRLQKSPLSPLSCVRGQQSAQKAEPARPFSNWARKPAHPYMQQLQEQGRSFGFALPLADAPRAQSWAGSRPPQPPGQLPAGAWLLRLLRPPWLRTSRTRGSTHRCGGRDADPIPQRSMASPLWSRVRAQPRALACSLRADR